MIKHSILIQKTRRIGKICFPFMTLVFSIWVEMVPLFGSCLINPHYSAGVVFFWSLYRPDRMPLSALIIIGFFLDILYGTLLGHIPLLWSFLYFCASAQRRFLFKESFKRVWIFFTASLLGYFILGRLFMLIFKSSLDDVSPRIFSFFMTVGCYPFLTAGLIYISKKIKMSLLKDAYYVESR